MKLLNGIIRFYLKVSGLCPSDNKYLRYAGPIVLTSMIVRNVPFQIWKILQLTNDPTILISCLNDVNNELLMLIKFCIMWRNRSEIQSLVRSVDHDWTNQKHTPRYWISLVDYISKFCRIWLMLYASSALLYYPDWIKAYLDDDPRNRHLIFHAYYPGFDYLASPYYELLNVMQPTDAFWLLVIELLSQSLLVALVLHASGRIHLLKGLVIDYFASYDAAKPGDNYKRLKSVHEEHQEILALVWRIDSAYCYISLIQIVFACMVICLTGYIMIVALQTSNVLFIMKFISLTVTMLGQAFSFCIAGQYLRDQGESLVRTLNDRTWYRMKPKDQLNLLFVLLKAQKPLAITCGKLFDLSINFFLQILKTSYSYLSVLRAKYSN